MKVHTYVINLKKRKDRLFACQRELKNAKVVFKRFNALEDIKYPYFGCSLSHRKILEIAKDKKYEMICVFEDDVIIHKPKTFVNDLKKILENIPPDWHILYLGGLVGRNSKFQKINNHLFKIDNIYCTYGIIYNCRSYEEIIHSINENHENDALKTKIGNELTIDNWLGKYYQKKYPCYITRKLLVGQRKSLSSISGKMTNLNKKYYIRFLFYKYGFGWFLRGLGIMFDYVIPRRKQK